jgi:hypothetical protein
MQGLSAIDNWRSVMERTPSLQSRRGAVAIALVITMLLVGMLLIGVVLSGSRDQSASIHRMAAVRAYYAAEAGANLSLREIQYRTDFDGDGKVGTIAGTHAVLNGFLIGFGNVVVTEAAAPTAGFREIRSIAAAEPYRRSICVIASPGTQSLGHTTEFSTYSFENLKWNSVATRHYLSAAGTITSISGYTWGGHKHLVRYAIYRDSSGNPGTLVAQTEIVAKTGSQSEWLTADIAPVSLTPGHYWLALAFSHNSQSYHYEPGGTTHHNGHAGCENGFAGNWGASTGTFNRRITLYATFTPSDAGEGVGAGKVASWQEIP